MYLYASDKFSKLRYWLVYRNCIVVMFMSHDTMSIFSIILMDTEWLVISLFTKLIMLFLKVGQKTL